MATEQQTKERQKPQNSKQSTERAGNVDKIQSIAHNSSADVNGAWLVCKERQKALQECIVQTRHKVSVLKEYIRGSFHGTVPGKAITH